ncbi:hypothetical protein O0V02_04670 [Gordonia amicalis]|uniref:hypothetical protein n=1 Tax=Gordonia amicalis TaxID=89053 RepID=UPI0022A7F879|nr:hypothetical protein [Gordonia amicalis]MCZ0911730.1 hypothetical protein [Gordonia amicalis]
MKSFLDSKAGPCPAVEVVEVESVPDFDDLFIRHRGSRVLPFHRDHDETELFGHPEGGFVRPSANENRHDRQVRVGSLQLDSFAEHLEQFG